MNSLHGWVLTFCSTIVGVLLLSLSSVWLNIERMDLAYDLTKLGKELNERTALAAKLEVERNNLLSPYRLNRLAEVYGLGPVGPGQMRIMRGRPDLAAPQADPQAAQPPARQSEGVNASAEALQEE